MNKYIKIFIFFVFLSGCVPVIGVSTVGVVRTTVEVADDPRSLGRIVDDNVIEKKFLFKIAQVDEKYLIKISANSLDGRFILKGNVDTVEEKIKMTKLAWETDGVRSVRNDIKIKEDFNFNQSAKDLLITSQLRTAIILNKEIKATNYQIDTYKKKIFIYGIAMTSDEKDLVIQEAKEILDVEDVIASIMLVEDLRIQKN